MPVGAYNMCTGAGVIEVACFKSEVKFDLDGHRGRWEVAVASEAC